MADFVEINSSASGSPQTVNSSERPQTIDSSVRAMTISSTGSRQFMAAPVIDMAVDDSKDD